MRNLQLNEHEENGAEIGVYVLRGMYLLREDLMPELKCSEKNKIVAKGNHVGEWKHGDFNKDLTKILPCRT